MAFLKGEVWGGEKWCGNFRVSLVILCELANKTLSATGISEDNDQS